MKNLFGIVSPMHVVSQSIFFLSSTFCVLIKGIVMVVIVCMGRCSKYAAVHEDVKMKVPPHSSDRKRARKREKEMRSPETVEFFSSDSYV